MATDKVNSVLQISVVNKWPSRADPQLRFDEQVQTNMNQLNRFTTELKQFTSDINSLIPYFYALYDISAQIQNVSKISADVVKVSGISAQVTDVSKNMATVTNLNKYTNNIVIVSNNIVKVNTVAGSINNVNAVGNSIGNVNAVAPHIVKVNTVAGSINNVNAVGSAIANVNILAPLKDTMITIVDNLDAIKNVSSQTAAAQAAANAARGSENRAKASEDAAKISETNAKKSEDTAKISETNAKKSEDTAKISETNAKKSEDTAKISETAAKISETNAKKSEDTAKVSETAALAAKVAAEAARDEAQEIVGTDYVPISRKVIAGTGLSGGGNLSADRTLTVNYATATPLMDGAAAVGSSVQVSRGDHKHPHDTTKLSLSGGTMTGSLVVPALGFYQRVKDANSETLRNFRTLSLYGHDTNGGGLALTANGLTVVGGGESANTIFAAANMTALGISPGVEHAIISADAEIWFLANVNTFANRKLVKITAAGDLQTAQSLLFQSGNLDKIRLIQGDYGVIMRHDGSSLFLLVTAKGDSTGTWTTARPLTIDLATGTCSINGTAAKATVLGAPRTIAISGGATGTATSFNGSANITIPVTGLDVSKANAGTLPVARGGTGRTDGKAVALATARTITLGGIVTGSTTFDGSGNVAIDVKASTTVRPTFIGIELGGNVTNGGYLDFHFNIDANPGLDYTSRIIEQSKGGLKIDAPARIDIATPVCAISGGVQGLQWIESRGSITALATGAYKFAYTDPSNVYKSRDILRGWGNDNTGIAVGLTGGGLTVIGGGESATDILNDKTKMGDVGFASYAAETLGIVSDTTIIFVTQCQTWANRKKYVLTDGDFFCYRNLVAGGDLHLKYGQKSTGAEKSGGGGIFFHWAGADTPTAKIFETASGVLSSMGIFVATTKLRATNFALSTLTSGQSKNMIINDALIKAKSSPIFVLMELSSTSGGHFNWSGGLRWGAENGEGNRAFSVDTFFVGSQSFSLTSPTTSTLEILVSFGTQQQAAKLTTTIWGL